MQALRLAPVFHERIWGGRRLAPRSPKPVGEAWIVHEDNRIVGGPYDGRTLADVAVTEGERLLGRRPSAQTGTRFPLLIKLLDATDWLSVQVHPDNDQAERLEGPQRFGKTEAWHILEADPGSRIISGFKPGTSSDMVEAALREGRLLDVLHYVPVGAGDTIFMRAGTVHALGPGLLLYEVQQTSDITYRVFDWNRPQTAGRELHIEKSLAVSDPHRTGRAEPAPTLTPGATEMHTLTSCEFFTLSLIAGEHDPLTIDTQRESFLALTGIKGSARLSGTAWQEVLRPSETVLIPAACGPFVVQPLEAFRALSSSAAPSSGTA